MAISRARHDQRGAHQEGGGAGVARHVDGAALELAVACNGDGVAIRRARRRSPARRSGAACARCGRAWLRPSMTVVAPGACSPAISTADLICAEATGSRYSIGSRSALPRMVSGSLSLPSSSISSPICCSGVSTRPMGRRESEASPTSTARAYRGRQPRPSSAARRCRNCRSRCRQSGSARPPTPRPSTSQVVPTLRTGQPSACSALAVLRTSSPSSRPAMLRAAGGQRPEHQRPVGDRLVAGNPDAARQRPRLACGQR